MNLLDGLGGRVHNDHIAMRSFVDSKGGSGLAFLDTAFTTYGYEPQSAIVIPGLPVNARWYEPPADADWPKIFVSELRTSELPDSVAAACYASVDGYFGECERGGTALRQAISACDGLALARLLDEPPWQPSAAVVAAVRGADDDDPALRSATEYAAWTLTHGHRINHLTILQNALGLDHPRSAHGDPAQARIPDLASLNALLAAEGFEFNPAGGVDGVTQGSPEKHLEQSSTVADLVSHTFGCGAVQPVPCAFLELIQRHEGFRGFLGQNAKGIFESTRSREA